MISDVMRRRAIIGVLTGGLAIMLFVVIFLMYFLVGNPRKDNP